ncbi:MAG: type II toxin-antitoxin system VapC family toxin [Desulfoferrobacter sp.]
MVLVDTSVWVRHLREGDSDLEQLLNNGEVMCHPYIVGELACGNMKNRQEVLSLLQLLPLVILARHEEILQFIELNHLMGKGLGYIDVHLAASAVLSGIPILSYDKKLNEVSKGLGIDYDPLLLR